MKTLLLDPCILYIKLEQLETDNCSDHLKKNNTSVTLVSPNLGMAGHGLPHLIVNISFRFFIHLYAICYREREREKEREEERERTKTKIYIMKI